LGEGPLEAEDIKAFREGGMRQMIYTNSLPDDPLSLFSMYCLQERNCTRAEKLKSEPRKSST
jgi:hypothetical protein